MTASAGVGFKEAPFLLTRPLRDVTTHEQEIDRFISISTHTPLAGRDIYPGTARAEDRKFLLTRPLRDVTSIR